MEKGETEIFGLKLLWCPSDWLPRGSVYLTAGNTARPQRDSLELLKLPSACAAIIFRRSLQGLSGGPCSRWTRQRWKENQGLAAGQITDSQEVLLCSAPSSLLVHSSCMLLLLVIWALFFNLLILGFHFFAFCFRNCIIIIGIEEILLLYCALSYVLEWPTKGTRSNI